MSVVNLADAKARLSELIDQVQMGETICITRHGKAVAQLVAAKPERKPIRIEDLEALTKDEPYQEESAGDFIRRMRDEDRY